ncbi:MAG: hypothetical protein ACI8Z5_001337 [Lentimonas sp.]|jgi:hypothetical protein
MKARNGKHFDQFYNAQAAVAVQSLLIVSNHLSDRSNEKLERLPRVDAALVSFRITCFRLRAVWMRMRRTVRM